MKMWVTAAMVFVLQTGTLFASEMGKVKPKFGRQATRLFHSNEYVRKNPAPDFWSLMPYYWAQQNNASCSLATLTMVMNAARASQDLTVSDELATEKGLIKKLEGDQRVKNVGDGKRGLSLDELADVVGKTLKVYGFEHATLETVHVNDSPASLAQLKATLAMNEKSADDFVIANFLQSELTGDPEGAIGHISPIAAYDAKKSRVLVFDTDRQYYEPYWVSTETLLKGMATTDSGVGKTRGYVHIRLGKTKGR